VSAGTNYSALDRALHRLAFSSPVVQETAADIEALLFGSQYRHLEVKKPIFVTSLPRAGTTLVLEVLARVPGIATHNYRDMPFVLAPILWNVLSRGFRKPTDLRERAHGDGMTIGYDSPEAFEEIVWRASWAAKYESDRIALWSDSEDATSFRSVFVDHIRKILALRSPSGHLGRYASKNNANVARIGFLKRLIPDSVILVPFRDPVDQALSLLQQHRRFGEMHAADQFSKQYMYDIGHLEFGQLHRPIQFDGMDEVGRRYQPDTLDYWVAYWVRAFRHVKTCQTSIILMSYETLCAAGPALMPALAERLAVSPDALTAALGPRMRAPRARSGETINDTDLVGTSRALYEELLDASVLPRLGVQG
jgi:hypothetical protein